MRAIFDLGGGFGRGLPACQGTAAGDLGGQSNIGGQLEVAAPTNVIAAGADKFLLVVLPSGGRSDIEISFRPGFLEDLDDGGFAAVSDAQPGGQQTRADLAGGEPG